jgi:hypothetical protein
MGARHGDGNLCSIRVAEFLLITPTATMSLAGTASRQKRTAFKALDGRRRVFSGISSDFS